MSKIDSAFSIIDRLIYNMNESFFGNSSAHYIKLETSDDEYTISADDGSMVSVLEVQGVMGMIGSSEFNWIIDQLYQTASNRFNFEGHALQIVFHYDPENIKNQVFDAMSTAKTTAKNLNMDMEGVLDDWAANLSEWCAVEKVWLVLWTRPSILPPAEKKQAKSNMGKSVAKSLQGINAQAIGKLMHELKSDHQNFLFSIENAFKGVGVLISKLTAHQILYCMRDIIDTEFTNSNWKALLPGDPLPKRFPDTGIEGDFSHVLYPKIKDQVWPREAEMIDRQVVKIGDKYHVPIEMSLPPQDIKPFNALFKTLISKKIPWRISFLITGHGFEVTRWKRIFTSVIHFGTNNKMFNNACDRLKEYEIEGGCITSLKVIGDTWTNAYEEDAEAQVRMRAVELASSMQGWGSADTREIIGDPVLGFTASVPAAMPVSPATPAAAPFEEVLKMLPLFRPAMPWKFGSILFRSPDGKVLPFHPVSSHQTSWVDIGVAPMGFGKSVLLNTYNLGFVLQPGLLRFPWLTIIDIGLSSSGLISLLKASLPYDQQYLVAFHRLRMSPEYSINPFDLPLGFQKPTQKHMSFLVNLLSLLATPYSESAPPEGVPGMAREAIKITYDEFSSKRKPKLYNPQVEPEIQKLLDNLGVHLDAKTSWWEVRDVLFQHNYIPEAVRAQRHAVPLLADIAGRVKTDAIRGMFKHTTSGNEVITDYFWRSCMEAINAYPILKESTRFDIGNAKIVSLDLDEVAPRGGREADRQSGVMYMLARHVAGGHLFMMEKDVYFADDMYKEYQTKRINEIRQDPKRICYDEAHRVTQNQSIADQLVADIDVSIRESRKWFLSVGLYTQSIRDLPDVITNELATNIFIMGAGSKSNIDEIADKIGLNNASRTAIGNIYKPGKSGGNLLAVFKTDKGQTTRLLTNTLGQQALWAFSTTSEDMAVRDSLYKMFNVKTVLEVLAYMYPGGIKPEVEKRRKEMEAKGFEHETEDVIDRLISEIADKIRDKAYMW